VLTDRFHDKIAVLDGHVLFIEESVLARVQLETNVVIAVRFAPDRIDNSCDDLALFFHVQPVGVIDVFPLLLEVGSAGCSR
jgi:hypothetical protein